MAMAAGLGKKRKVDEWDVSDMEQCSSGTVHGIVTELSPVKVSRKNTSVRYFDGRISDRRNSVRVIFFEPALRSAMESAWQEKSAVSVVNCSVKEARSKEDGMEIMVTKKSKIETSPRKFCVPMEMFNLETKHAQLSELRRRAQLRRRRSVQVTLHVW